MVPKSRGSVLEGPNVCEKTETFEVVTQVPTKIPFKVKSYEWCAKPPFRCPVMKTDYKPGYRNETSTVVKNVKVCCEGYAEYEGRCVSSIVHYVVTSSPGDSGNTTRTFVETLNAGPSQFVTAGQSGESSSSPALWIGLCFALLMVIAFSMLLLFRYKKKLLQVKEELNYVTYTTERGSTGNLENPVYATVNPSDSSIPNNSVRNFVVNDLKSCKTNNKMLESASPAAVGVRTSATSTKSSNIEIAAALKKNRELDAETGCLASCALASGTSSSLSGDNVPLKPLNCNLYQSLGKDADREPIYEELEESSISSASTSTNSGLHPESSTPIKTTHPVLSPVSSPTRERNDLSGHSVYDRPRPSNLNISLSSPTASSTTIKNVFTPTVVASETRLSSPSSSISSSASSSSLGKEQEETNKKLSRKELFTASNNESSIDSEVEDREPQTRNSTVYSNSCQETHLARQEVIPEFMEVSSSSFRNDIPVVAEGLLLDSRNKRPASEAIYSVDVNATQDE
jgi:hypothetical protein